MNRLPIIVLVALGLFATVANAGGRSVEHRMQLGINMFPTMVGGNLALKAKPNADGKLLLVIVYREDPQVGNQVAEKLRGTVKRIYKYPIRVAVTNSHGFGAFSEERIAGIFFAEQLSPEQRDAVARFGIEKKAVVFSPFNGDVREGVMAGLHVSTRVLPALNLSTLRKAGMQMHKLFLKLAKIY